MQDDFIQGLFLFCLSVSSVGWSMLLAKMVIKLLGRIEHRCKIKLSIGRQDHISCSSVCKRILDFMHHVPFRVSREQFFPGSQINFLAYVLNGSFSCDFKVNHT